MIDIRFFRDDLERVHQQLLTQPDAASLAGRWHVYETISADGTLAIGIAEGMPDPGIVMVVYENLSRPVALLAAKGLATWYRDCGREVGGAVL